MSSLQVNEAIECVQSFRAANLQLQQLNKLINGASNLALASEETTELLPSYWL